MLAKLMCRAMYIVRHIPQTKETVDNSTVKRKNEMRKKRIYSTQKMANSE